MPENAEIVQRLAIYARVSTEEQREGQTIDSQISELDRFARDKGWPIVGTYKDEGWSGGVMERPELDRLRDDAQKGMFDAVLINDVDRLARDVSHLGVIKRDLERKGIKVIFRKLPSETSPTYNLMVNILGSFAEFERELIADRTRRGRRHKIEVRKQYLGSNTAYGYRYTPMDRASGREGLLEVVPAEAQVVQQMFAWVDQEGLSAKRVLARLNSLKIPPKKGAPLWAKSSVLRILHCETYAGTWHYNKFQSCEPRSAQVGPRYRKRSKCGLRLRPRAEWIPLELAESLRIVPRERWERVQQQLARNIAFSPRNEKHAYLLKSLVRCGACGGSYVGEPCHGKFYYRCYRRCHRVPTVREVVLNDAVKGAVRGLMTNPKVILEPLRRLQDAEAREAAQSKYAGAEIMREEKRLAAEEQRVLDAYRTGVISPRQLGQQLEVLRARQEAITNKRQALEQACAVVPGDAKAAVSDYCLEASRELASFSEERWRELLREVIVCVIFNGDRVVIRGRIPVPSLGPAGQFQVSQDLPPVVRSQSVNMKSARSF